MHGFQKNSELLELLFKTCFIVCHSMAAYFYQCILWDCQGWSAKTHSRTSTWSCLIGPSIAWSACSGSCGIMVARAFAKNCDRGNATRTHCKWLIQPPVIFNAKRQARSDSLITNLAADAALQDTLFSRSLRVTWLGWIFLVNMFCLWIITRYLWVSGGAIHCSEFFLPISLFVEACTSRPVSCKCALACMQT